MLQKIEDYNNLINKGAAHFITLLKNNKLFYEVSVRIKRKNNSDPEKLIPQLITNPKNLSEYIFSDLHYHLDHFYEGLELNIENILDLSFAGIEYEFQIITEFINWQTKEIEDSITYHSDKSKNDYERSIRIADRCLTNSNLSKWKIELKFKDKTARINWNDYSEDNLITLLNSINQICRETNLTKAWLPIASSQGSNFIFTTPKNYESICALSLMPPNGYIIDEDHTVYYPKGIVSASITPDEILPLTNINCEVPMGKEEKIIFVKLWKKSQSGHLDKTLVPDLIIKKLTSLSGIGNRLNWQYGKIILDANGILESTELDLITAKTSEMIEQLFINKTINLEGQKISFYQNNIIKSPIKELNFNSLI